MPRKGHNPEQILNKLRQVEVAVAGGKSVGAAVREIGVTGLIAETSLDDSSSRFFPERKMSDELAAHLFALTACPFLFCGTSSGCPTGWCVKLPICALTYLGDRFRFSEQFKIPRPSPTAISTLRLTHTSPLTKEKH